MNIKKTGQITGLILAGWVLMVAALATIAALGEDHDALWVIDKTITLVGWGGGLGLVMAGAFALWVKAGKLWIDDGRESIGTLLMSNHKEDSNE